MGKRNYLYKRIAQTHHSQNWPCTATIHNGEVCAVERAYSLRIVISSFLLFRGASSFWEASMILCLLRNTMQIYTIFFYKSVSNI